MRRPELLDEPAPHAGESLRLYHVIPHFFQLRTELIMREDTGCNNMFTSTDTAGACFRDARDHIAPDVTRTLRPLSVAAHPTRLKILLAIGADELCVQTIAVRVGVPPNNVSHHLALLGNNGVVTSRRDANHIYYRVTDATVPRVIALVCDLVNPSRAIDDTVPVPEATQAFRASVSPSYESVPAT